MTSMDRNGCDETRQWLRSRFDAGGDFGAGRPAHLDVCSDCQAYLERLRALDGALMRLPEEEPGVAFEERLCAAVARSQTVSRWKVLAAACAACVAAVAAGWFLPLDATWRAWMDSASSYVPRPDWQGLPSYGVEEIQRVWHAATALLESSWAPSRASVWSLTIAAVLLLASVNAFQFMKGAHGQLSASPAASRNGMPHNGTT